MEQFKDQLVLILLGSAIVSFVLALFEESDDWTAFVDPVVVRSLAAGAHLLACVCVYVCVDNSFIHT